MGDAEQAMELPSKRQLLQGCCVAFAIVEEAGRLERGLGEGSQSGMISGGVMVLS